jgi:nucleotide-binding universal stress UspA family protein
VRAVLVWTFLRQHHVDRTQKHDPEYSEEDAVLALQEYVTDAVGADAARDIELDVVTERAAVGLVAAAADSSLLVVGSHGYGGISGRIMGSVSQECLHVSTVPVAIIRCADQLAESGREPAEVEPGKIVVGIDGSDTSRRALTWALDEARARGGWVEVVYSWLLPAAYGYPTLAVPDIAVYEEAAESLVSQFIDGADVSGLSRPVSRIVVGGTSTAGLLADRAIDAELLVVGSRGVGGFRGMLVGSVAHHLAHHAPCPLVVLPAAHAAD